MSLDADFDLFTMNSTRLNASNRIYLELLSVDRSDKWARTCLRCIFRQFYLDLFNQFVASSELSKIQLKWVSILRIFFTIYFTCSKSMELIVSVTQRPSNFFAIFYGIQWQLISVSNELPAAMCNDVISSVPVDISPFEFISIWFSWSIASNLVQHIHFSLLLIHSFDRQDLGKKDVQH